MESMTLADAARILAQEEVTIRATLDGRYEIRSARLVETAPTLEEAVATGSQMADWENRVAHTASVQKV